MLKRKTIQNRIIVFAGHKLYAASVLVAVYYCIMYITFILLGNIKTGYSNGFTEKVYILIICSLLYKDCIAVCGCVYACLDGRLVGRDVDCDRLQTRDNNYYQQ